MQNIERSQTIITSLSPRPHPHPQHIIPFSVLARFPFISLCDRLMRSTPLLPAFASPPSPPPLFPFPSVAHPSPTSLLSSVPSPFLFCHTTSFPLWAIPKFQAMAITCFSWYLVTNDVFIEVLFVMLRSLWTFFVLVITKTLYTKHITLINYWITWLT